MTPDPCPACGSQLTMSRHLKVICANCGRILATCCDPHALPADSQVTSGGAKPNDLHS